LKILKFPWFLTSNRKVEGSIDWTGPKSLLQVVTATVSGKFPAHFLWTNAAVSGYEAFGVSRIPWSGRRAPRKYALEAEQMPAAKLSSH
jgi:hypothetical protein